MSEVTVKYEDGLLTDLADPVEAAAYLDAALEDGDQQVFLLALRDVAEVHGMARAASGAGLNRENMYRMLSTAGNPRFSSLNSLLHSFGLRLSVEAIQAELTADSVTALAENPASYT